MLYFCLINNIFYYNSNINKKLILFMEYITNFNKAQTLLRKKKTKIKPIDNEILLMDSLAYDWEYSIEKMAHIKDRKKFIQKKFIKNQINSLQLKFDETLEYMKTKYSHISSDRLITLLIIESVLQNWSQIFWAGSKKITYKIDAQIDTDQGTIRAICRLLYQILREHPLQRFNVTKGLLLTNYLLNNIWIPGIIFAYRDRKRILRSLDTYIDFEKEFFLTLEWRCHKSILEDFAPKWIISLVDLRKEKNTTHTRVKPGQWWYWEDGRKYTISPLALSSYCPIEFLKVSPRTLNALLNWKIFSIEELEEYTEDQLSRIKGLWGKAIIEIRNAQVKWELSWSKDVFKKALYEI